MTDEGIKGVNIHIRKDDKGRSEVWMSATTGQRHAGMRDNRQLAIKDNEHFTVIDFNAPISALRRI